MPISHEITPSLYNSLQIYSDLEWNYISWNFQNQQWYSAPDLKKTISLGLSCASRFRRQYTATSLKPCQTSQKESSRALHVACNFARYTVMSAARADVAKGTLWMPLLTPQRWECDGRIIPRPLQIPSGENFNHNWPWPWPESHIKALPVLRSEATHFLVWD